MKQCPYCDREFKHQGSLNLHKIKCENTYLKGQLEKPKENVPRETKTGCEHEFRLLNKNSFEENSAYNAGFKQICSKCEELK